MNSSLCLYSVSRRRIRSCSSRSIIISRRFPSKLTLPWNHHHTSGIRGGGGSSKRFNSSGCSEQRLRQRQRHLPHNKNIRIRPYPGFYPPSYYQCFSTTNNNNNGGEDSGIVAPDIVVEDDDYDDEDEDDERLPFASVVDDVDSEDEGTDENVFEDEGNGNDTTVGGLFTSRNTSPKWELNTHYMEEHGLSNVVAKNIEAECTVEPKRKKTNWTGGNATSRRAQFWTATFRCPVTGLLYQAGTLWSVVVDRDATESSSSCELKESSAINIEGKVYYSKKNTALHAAAGRALDAIQWNKLGIIEPRFCLEDPSHMTTTTTGDAEASDADDGTDPSDIIGANILEAGDEASQYSVIDNEIMEDDAPTIPSEQEEFVLNKNIRTESVLLPNDDEDDELLLVSESVDPGEDTDQEDDYIVTQLPTSFGGPPSQRILEALSNKPADDQESEVSSHHVGRMPTALAPVSRLRLAVDMATAWADAINMNRSPKRRTRNPHRQLLPQVASPSDLLAGKVLLAGLAEGNQSTSISNFQYGVEIAANQVLDVLWQDECTYPDADTYSLYLKCIEGRHPVAVAKRAEKIVTAMRTRQECDDGRVLPEPNIGTINVLIQLWAQAGGTTGRYENLPDDFQPNRESFLSILSSNIYRPVTPKESGSLDADFANECIGRMRELAKEDESLLPDTQVYNAPLRWSSGSLFRKSRPYARQLPWDHYTVIYNKGLKSITEDTQTVSEARAFDAWMEGMLSSGDERIVPDIETYEAVIQAWLRTGTREGLERAQALALSLLESPSDTPQPRLLTFRPLILSWTLSKDADGPPKVQELVDRLEVASECIPELRPDGRIMQLLIASHLTYQLSIFEDDEANAHSKESAPSIDIAVGSARECSRALDKLCRDFKLKLELREDDVDLFIETTPFEETIFAWQNVASAALVPRDDGCLDDLFDNAIEEMVRVVEEFEKCVKVKQRSESPDSLGLRESLLVSLQLKHFLAYAHRVYSAFIVGTLQISKKHSDSSQINSDSEGLLIKHMGLVESMLRKNAEYDSAVSHAMSLEPEITEKKSFIKRQGALPHGNRFAIQSRISYEDQFASDTSPKALKRLGWNRNNFLRHVADYLSDIEIDKVNVGDFVRICLLIKETGSGRHPLPKAVHMADRLLEKVLPNSRDHERRRVRRFADSSSRKPGIHAKRSNYTRGTGSHKYPRRHPTATRRRINHQA